MQASAKEHWWSTPSQLIFSPATSTCQQVPSPEAKAASSKLRQLGTAIRQRPGHIWAQYSMPDLALQKVVRRHAPSDFPAARHKLVPSAKIFVYDLRRKRRTAPEASFLRAPPCKHYEFRKKTLAALRSYVEAAGWNPAESQR